MTRRIRLMMAWMMVLSMTVGSGAYGAMAQEGTPAVPPSSATQLFAVDGIDAPVVASAPVADASSIDGALLLERLELPAGASQSPRTTASAELYYVESGALSIQDAFGFGTTIPAGNALPLNAGTTVTLANRGAEPAVVLRLRLSDGVAAASDATDGEATPVDLTAGTTQGADEIAPTVLVQMPVSGLSLDSGQVFLSRATFSPGSATGEQGHAGPIGIYVESGALNVVSPSGFQGTIGAGQGVSLPAETPLQASTVDSEAMVLIVGIGAADAPFGEVTPEPVAATEEATEAAVTDTPEPTEEAASSDTVLFQAGNGTPFGSWVSASGWSTLDNMVLSDGQQCSYLVAPVDLGGVRDYAIEAEIQLVSLPAYSSFGLFGRWSGDLRYISGMYTDRSDSLENGGSAFISVADERFKPGDESFRLYPETPLSETNMGLDTEWHTYRFEQRGNELRLYIDGAEISRATDNRLVQGGDAGLFCNRGAQISVRSFTIEALGDGAATGQVPPSSESAASGEGSSSAPAGNDSGTATSINIQDSVASLSPPDGLAVKEQGSLGVDQITATFSDPAAVSRFFDDWGWQENAFVYYEPPNGGSSADGLVYVDVELHRFATADGASQALTYFADVRRDQIGLGDVQISPIGEQTRALMGATDMGTEASVYSRVGTVAIRVSVMSVGTDPLAVAVGIVQGMVGAPQASAAPPANAAPVDLFSLLPGAGDVPAQLVITGERNRTLAEVAENYVSPADTTALFTGWGWQGNVTRAWQLPSGANVEPTQINGVYVSVHVFDNPQGAAAALDLSLVDQSTLTGAWEVDSPGLGDYSRALWGQETYGNEITLLVQRGNVFIRVSAAQLEGDPTPVAAGIVQGIIGRAG